MLNLFPTSTIKYESNYDFFTKVIVLLMIFFASAGNKWSDSVIFLLYYDRDITSFSHLVFLLFYDTEFPSDISNEYIFINGGVCIF